MIRVWGIPGVEEGVSVAWCVFTDPVRIPTSAVSTWTRMEHIPLLGLRTPALLTHELDVHKRSVAHIYEYLSALLQYKYPN